MRRRRPVVLVLGSGLRPSRSQSAESARVRTELKTGEVIHVTMWTTLIICVTLVLLGLISLCAWLPYLKWGTDLIRDLGADGLGAFTQFIKAWPHPLRWLGQAASGLLSRSRSSGKGSAGEERNRDELRQEPPDAAA